MQIICLNTYGQHRVSRGHTTRSTGHASWWTWSTTATFSCKRNIGLLLLRPKSE